MELKQEDTEKTTSIWSLRYVAGESKGHRLKVWFNFLNLMALADEHWKTFKSSFFASFLISLVKNTAEAKKDSEAVRTGDDQRDKRARILHAAMRC